MLSVFWSQLRALTKKNLIVIRNHWILNILRCFVLPIVFALFFAYAYEIFALPNNLGFGTRTSIVSLADTWNEGTIYYLDHTNSSSRVPDFISRFITSANLSPAQQARVKSLSSQHEIQHVCPSNFRLLSECFAVLVFNYIPYGADDPRPLSYTIRIDVGRRMVDVGRHTSDYERVALPLQWAVDKTGMEIMGVKGLRTPQEWPYTIRTNEEAQLLKRLSYVDTVESLLVFAFSLIFVIIVYQLSGAFIDECASGLASLMHVMGCSSSARIVSWYLSISIFHVPAWVVTAIVWHYRVFTKTNVGLLVLIHVIAGFSITSFSLLACFPFRKSPQLAAIGTTFLVILFSIVGLLVPMIPSVAALYTFALPPGFFVFAIKAVSCFEKDQRAAQALLTRGDSNARVLGCIILVGLANIFLWLLAAAIVERWMLDPSAGTIEMFLRRLYRNLRPGCMSQGESELVASDKPHMPIITSKSHTPSSAITLDGLTKKFPSAKWSAPEYTAVKDLSMSIPSQGIFVLLGANGSGKSTTLKMISGLEKQTSGSIHFGDDVYHLTEKGRVPTKKAKRSLGLVPQKDILFPELTCYQTLRLWQDLKLSHVHASNLFETALESVEQLLGDCDLRTKIHSSAATLSGGQKRRLQLAAGLVGGSRIVLVDEATSGVDPLSRRAIWRALGKAREGRCIVFTTHFLDEADLLADEIAVLAAPGKLLAQGSPVSLKSELGDGYSISVTRTPDAPLSFDSSILSTIRRHAPLATPDTSEHGVYILHSKDAEIVRAVLDALEESKGELGLASYDLRGITMEGVFLKLLRTEEDMGRSSPRPESDLEQDDAASVHSDSIAADETLIAGGSQADIGGKFDSLALSDGHKTSPFRQALTEFHKRMLIMRRSWFSYALMIAIGIAGACVPLVFIKDRTNSCTLAQRMERIYPLYLPGARILPAPILAETVPESYHPVICPPNLLEALNASSLPQNTVPDAAAFSQTIEKTYKNLSLGGLEILDGQATIAWEASPGSLSGLALLNLASNLLLNNASGRDGSGSQIVAFFQGLPGTRLGNMASWIEGAAAKWEGLFSASMGVWPAFLALYVSAERRSCVQAMQLSNGMTPAGLWLGHLLFDLPWITLIVTAIVIISGTVTSQFYGLGVLWVVLELYAISGALFAYLVSTFAKSPIAAFAMAGGYNAIMSLLYGSAYILTMTHTRPSQSESVLQIVHYTLSLVAPIVSVVRAAIISVNLFSVLCDGRGNFSSSSPITIEKFGGPIVYLIGWIVFLFSLLMWVEYGKPIPTWLRRNDATELLSPDFEELVTYNGMFGAEVRAEAERVHNSNDSLRVLDVSKKFPGRFTAVDTVSFGINNETFALLGPNGAGKTTTFNMIRGNVRPSRGDIQVCGKSIVHNQADARLALGVTPQFTAVDSQLTVEEHLLIYGSLKGLHGKELKRNVGLLMEATALTKYAGRFATKLSGGNGRKLALALSLIGNPRVLLIDEYSTGVDAATKRTMWKTLQRVSHGKAVVITTHSMEEASALASRVGILAKRMLAIGSLDALASRFSTYEVHFAARTPLEVSRASTLMSRLPGARQVEDLATRYEVPIGQTSLAELFRTLSDQRAGEGDDSGSGVKLDYTVERIGLESVFLRVIQERDDVVKSKSKLRPWWKIW